MGRTSASGASGAQGKGRAETLAHIILGQATIMILIQGIKHGIGPQPFITGDAAIAIEIIQQENLLNGMAKGSTAFEFSQSVAELLFEGLDGFAEALDPFTELVGGHAIGGHLLIKGDTVDMQLRLSRSRFGGIQLAAQRLISTAKLVEKLG